MMEAHKTVCSNCSCHQGVKKVVYDSDGKVNGEFMELFQERKKTGRTFKCYMRTEPKACKLMWESLKYFDKTLIIYGDKKDKDV